MRGRAIEPLVRESLARLLPDEVLPAAPALGGYWTRSNDIEIDLVGADRQPVAEQSLFLGSVKWLENAAFDSHDLAALQSCGGAPGYSDLKAVLADPAHEEHHAVLAWLGLRSATEFTSARFAPDGANAWLSRLTAS